MFLHAQRCICVYIYNVCVFVHVLCSVYVSADVWGQEANLWFHSPGAVPCIYLFIYFLDRVPLRPGACQLG